MARAFQPPTCRRGLTQRVFAVDHHLERPARDQAKARIATQVEAHIWPLIARGAFKVVVDSEYPVSEAPAAHWRLESSGHVGKILLKVEGI